MGLTEWKCTILRFQVQKSRSKVLADLDPFESHEGESVPGPCPCFWWLAGHLWHFLACGYIPLIYVLMFTWCFHCVSGSKFLLFYKNTYKAHLTPVLSNYIRNDPISKYGHILRYEGSRLEHMNFGGLSAIQNRGRGGNEARW